MVSLVGMVGVEELRVEGVMVGQADPFIYMFLEMKHIS
jgi:hypothetical protein